MELANQKIRRERQLDDQSFDDREAVVIRLSEIAGVYLRRDGPFVAGRLDELSRREGITDKLRGEVGSAVITS